MAGMTTVLTEFADNGNSRTFTIPASGHTAVKPRLVIQRRKVPLTASSNAEMTVAVIFATEDVDGNVLSAKTAFEASVRYPSLGDAADITAALAVFRDIVAGDEFGNAVTTQNWLS